MRFRIGSHLLVADVAQEESFVSPRTGATLRRLVIVFEADDDPTHEEYLELLDAARNSPSPREHGLASETEEGNSPGAWRVADAAVGPAPGRSATARQHRWVLEE